MKIIKYIFVCFLALWASALSAQSWSGFDFHKYQYDMTIYYKLTNATLDKYEIAAFVGDECRGVSKFVTATGDKGVSMMYGFLKVYSNVANGETVTFKFYNKEGKTEGPVPNVSMDFVSQDVKGMPSSPIELDLGVYDKKGDVNGDGDADSEDLQAIVDFLLGNPPAKFSVAAADVNNDGVINVTDIVFFVNYILLAE